MSIIKIEDFKPEETIFIEGFTYYKPTNSLLHLQTDFMSLKPYGIPRKNGYQKTDDQRRYFQVPLYQNELTQKLKLLDSIFRNQVGDTYTRFIKAGKNDYEDFIKIKFDLETKITILNDQDYEKVEYKTIDQLRDKLKFFYPIRFLLCFTSWNYLGKKGVKIYATHIQGKEENTKISHPDDFIDKST